MSGYYTIFVTVPDIALAEKISMSLVGDELAACVNIINPIRSIYMWQGEICDDQELLLIIKTRQELFDRVKKAILADHTYDTPEIIALTIEKGHEPYLAWISEVTK